jgi:hypothetical protein
MKAKRIKGEGKRKKGKRKVGVFLRKVGVFLQTGFPRLTPTFSLGNRWGFPI